MKKAKKALKEIEVSMRRIDMFVIIIKTLVLLMVSYLFLFILGIRQYYAFIPAFVYFISSLFIEARTDRLRRVEAKYQELDERLRTAKDYRDRDNSILKALEEEIIEKLRTVSMDSFFSMARTIILLLLLVVAVTSSLYISSEDIKLIDFNDVIDAAVKRFTQDDAEEQEEVNFGGSEESIMEVGNERIEVEINPVGMDFDFDELTEEGEYEFSTSFPKDVFISSGASYEEEYTEEQQILIKKYFEKRN
ncbi:hypothetical protein GF323_04115 [Candidatus Woesearchaeota archaeon]|nr:hypothetical protein [Candidatus Woesearchaeota archaeon]